MVKSRGKEEEGRRVEWGFLAGLLGQGKVEEVVIHPLYLGEEERERRRRRIGAACPVMSFLLVGGSFWFLGNAIYTAKGRWRVGRERRGGEGWRKRAMTRAGDHTIFMKKAEKGRIRITHLRDVLLEYRFIVFVIKCLREMVVFQAFDLPTPESPFVIRRDISL